jgi:hypothetical protein
MKRAFRSRPPTLLIAAAADHKRMFFGADDGRADRDRIAQVNADAVVNNRLAR